MDEDEVNLDSTSENILRPKVPAPTASNEDVQQFLTQFFRALCSRRTLREARIMAERIDADGVALYEISPKRWSDEFAFEGDTIYAALRRSNYGIYSRVRIGLGLQWLQRHLLSQARLKDFSSLLEIKTHEPSYSQSSAQYSQHYSGSSICTAEPNPLMTTNGFQKDSRSDNEGWYGEGESQGIRHRQLYPHDTD